MFGNGFHVKRWGSRHGGIKNRPRTLNSAESRPSGVGIAPRGAESAGPSLDRCEEAAFVPHTSVQGFAAPLLNSKEKPLPTFEGFSGSAESGKIF